MAEIKPPIVLNFTPPAGGAASRFGIEDNTSDVDRSVDFNNSNRISLINATNIELAAGDYNNYVNPVSELGLRPNQVALQYSNYSAPDAVIAGISFGEGSSGKIQFHMQAGASTGLYELPIDPLASYIPLSINGQRADPTGNITLAATGGGGAASRFGIEDNTSDVDRVVNFGAHNIDILTGGPDAAQSEIYIATGVVMQYTQGDDTTANAISRCQTGNYIIEANENGQKNQLIVRGATTTISRNRGTEMNLALSVNNTFADATGNITLSKGEFADNAAALAGGLTLGDTYHTAGVLKIVI